MEAFLLWYWHVFIFVNFFSNRSNYTLRTHSDAVTPFSPSIVFARFLNRPFSYFIFTVSNYSKPLQLLQCEILNFFLHIFHVSNSGCCLSPLVSPTILSSLLSITHAILLCPSIINCTLSSVAAAESLC